MKQCSECGENKSEKAFYKKKAGYLSSRCKGCMSVYYKKRYKESTREVMQQPILSREEARILYEQIYA